MTRTLRIAMLSHVASPEVPTGAERSLALLARGLHGRGHEVCVVAPGPWVLEAELAESGVETATVPTRACWLAYWEPRPWPVAGLKWLRCVAPDPGGPVLERRLAAWRPDVVHVICLPHLTGARRAASLGLPLVWHLREILPPGRRRRWWAGHLARLPRRIVAVSGAVAAWLTEEGLEGRVDVVHNGVAPTSPAADRGEARRALELPDDGRCLVGLLGQLQPHKGAIELVRAGRLALRETDALRFLIAGGGPEDYRARLEREIESGAHADRFHRLPPRPDPATLLAACDVIALTTLTPDPFPRAVLEAMAAARPVVAFRSGGTPEMVEHDRQGLLAEGGDLASLAAHLARLAGDPALRESLGSAGRRRAEAEFSLDRHVERMEAVLGAACGA